MRRLSQKEEKLLKLLLAGLEPPLEIGPLDQLEVQPMNDGGMGSLYFPHSEKSESERLAGLPVAQAEITDDDGVLVSAALYLDQDRDLYELDVWKVDFSPTVFLRDE